MSLILAAVVASGVLGSKLLLKLGVHSMRLRYPLAILGSYVVFFLLVRVWIWYVSRVHNRSFGFGNTQSRRSGSGMNFGGGGGSVDIEGGGGSGSFRGFGGGSSGGGGASDSWGPGAEADIAPPVQGSGGGGGGSHWFSGSGGGDLDLGDDWAILLLLAVLVLAIVFAGGYLIYAAPNLLPEAAWQAGMAATLARATKDANHRNWLTCVLRGSAIPFTIILILGGALGWEARKHCPQAVKLSQVWYCSVGHPQPADPDTPPIPAADSQ
ncbi:MAG TPA: hypothetical protein VGV35_02065 [Bryobacteraceae bacterium]|nr:hypothetical protein [Bryobacteraceae bacterium]